MKLLIVEDSTADLRLLQVALLSGPTDSAPELHLVRTLAEAEAAVRAASFDCVLLDLGLPDGAGVQNVQRIRAARSGQTVVVISGHEGEDIAIEALRHGAQEYLHKGEYTGEDVLRVIRRAVERDEQLRAVDKAREEQFRLATRDTLTGVSNRRLLQQLAGHTIAQSARNGWSFAVAFLDLDRFKLVNDRWGHACGDQLLRKVGAVLAGSVRDVDTVARIGGDEFLLMLAPPLNLEQARAIVCRIQERIVAITVVDGHRISVGASVGLAFYPQHGTTLEALMAGADHAMYRAKQGAPGRLALYAPLDGSQAKAG